MKDAQGVNIPMPTTPSQHIQSDMGLNLIDLAFVQLLMRKILPEDKAESVCRVLQNVVDSMNTLSSLAQVTEQMMLEATAQRDTALEGAHQAIDQRNAAVYELERLMRAIEQIDQTHEPIALLVRTVWDAAQADLINQMNSDRGA